MDYSTTINRRGAEGEISASLNMTQEQFDQLVSMYSTGNLIEKRHTGLFERIKKATAEAPEGMELIFENFESVDTEGFEKTICWLSVFTEHIMREMQKNKSLHICINYDAEALKTDVAVYTPKQDTSTDMMQESQKD